MRTLALLGGLAALSSTPAYAAQAACPELSTLEHLQAAFTGLTALIDIGSFFGIALLAGGSLMVIGWLAMKLKFLSPIFWEVVGYVAAIALLTSGLWVPEYLPAIAQHIGTMAIIGSLLAAGMIVVTGNVHEIEPDMTVFHLMLIAIFGTTAIIYSSAPIAFFAVLALLSLSGFSVGFGALTYAFGFGNDKKLVRATVLATVLAGVFLALKGSGVAVPQAVQIFETGALWAGSIVSAIGLLIISSVWYDGGEYKLSVFVRRVIAIGILAVGMFFGAVYESNVVMYVAAVFCFLCIIEWPYEWAPKNFLAYAITTAAVGAVVLFTVLWVQDNFDLVNQYVANMRT